jgi:hypothetical protein
MGFLDRLFGASEPEYTDNRATRTARSDDEIALERYRYLLRTAPPERIEQVHAEAFAQLTPQQREQLFEELKRSAPDGEAPRSDDAQALAASATRSELRQPGYLERTMGPRGGGYGGPSFGSIFASSLLGSVAGYVIGSAIMSAFLPDPYGFDGADASGVDGADASGGADASSADASGGDWGGGGGDFGGGDFGGDFGDF